jgi:hypothetical protein
MKSRNLPGRNSISQGRNEKCMQISERCHVSAQRVGRALTRGESVEWISMACGTVQRKDVLNAVMCSEITQMHTI